MEVKGIRPIEKQDFEAVAAIYNEYIALGNATMEETLKSGKDIAQWVEKFNNREGLFVLCSEQQVIGWGIIKRYSDREGYRFACETAVYLTKTELGKGYGSDIKRFLIEKCKELNYKHLVAKIFAENQASITYNERIGYTVVGRQNKVGFKNGKWQDIVIMQYLIEE